MNSFKLPIKWAGTAMLALFLSSALQATEPYPPPSTVSLDCAQPLSAEAELAVQELSPESGIEWSIEISPGRQSIAIVASAGPGGLPADMELVDITVFDPSTGYQETWRLGTGGGATLLVIADL